MTLRVGLTGGIGSGKTTVSDRFAEHGVDVIDADVIAHEVTRAGESVVGRIADEFGEEVLDADGALDRAALHRLVFSDSSKRHRLEAMLHPAIRERMDARVQASTTPYCILSIPLLVESRDASRVDRVLVVDAPDASRRRWIKARSGLSDEEIEGIFHAQASREERLNAADDVIVNDGSLEQLRARVDELHLRYLDLAESLARLGEE